MDKLLSIEEVQARIPVKITTLRYWIASKQLPVVRCGRRVFVKKSIVEKIVENGLETKRENKNA